VILAVDTSAVLAILLDEPEMLAFVRIILSADRAMISAGNVVEIYRVAHGRAVRRSLDGVDELLQALKLRVEPLEAGQLRLAREGMERFGKGRGEEPAVLNFGDLFAYALARSLAAPLLFKGDDFSRTDVTPAWTP
jgi:ribonuclease VapC